MRDKGRELQFKWRGIAGSSHDDRSADALSFIIQHRVRPTCSGHRPDQTFTQYSSEAAAFDPLKTDALIDRAVYGHIQEELAGEKFLLLNNEGCTRCDECTYPDAPCRFPEKLYPSIEGYGFLVSALAKQAGIPYIGKPTELRYFGA